MSPIWLLIAANVLLAHGLHATCPAARQPKIIIVGAGLAGLTAATHLMENGYSNVLILEAEERFGGRIHSVEFEDGFIDLGAQWVHGQVDNIIYDMTKGHYNFGLSGFDTHFNEFIQSDRGKIDQKMCEHLFEVSAQLMFASCGELSNYNKSLGEYHKEKFLSTVKAKKYSVDSKLIGEMEDYFEKEMNIWNASRSWFDLSAKLHCANGFNQGPSYQTWNRDGFKTFFKLLSHQNDPEKKPVNVFNKILYKKTVVNVQWNQNYALDTRFVIATCTDGHKYFADHLIFTPSLGVLKERYLTLFSPQLPRPMITAIKSMGFGSIGKIFFEFEKPFWPRAADWVGYGFLWTREDIERIKGTKRKWLLDLQAFTIVDGFPNLLEALLGGPNQETFERLSDDALIQDCLWLLEKFLGKSIPKPKSMRRTKWQTHKNFLGAYSYLSMDAMRNNISPEDLSRSLYNLKGKPEVLFAGEATDPLFSSNAHGAVNTGLRAAKEIMMYHKERVC